MTIPPIQGGIGGSTPLRVPVLTAPVSTGVPPVIGDEPLVLPKGAPPAGSPPTAGAARQDPPISLAGRLDLGDLLPDTTRLALALESATRALQNGRPDLILTELDTVWSNQLASDSPWYLRTAALQLLGRTGDAEQVMREAIQRLPRSAALLYLLGVHCASRNQTEAARLANDHALALHPTEPLLWLQRAALSQSDGMTGTAAAILEHVVSMTPAFPASAWLETLARLGQGSGRTPTPSLQRAIARLTPAGVPAIVEHFVEPRATPAAAPFASTVLDTALRYGLTLLESPTQSARTATHAGAASDAPWIHAELLACSTPAPTPRPELPSWESLLLIAGLIVIALVPPLRIPALVVSGVMALLITSRRMR
ncbi:MAG: hypothetical protein H7099_01165 [Gemmatimonadaceae bacterium]|nr:hypothetical protein [Gemmatimonadaceae bacterium]